MIQTVIAETPSARERRILREALDRMDRAEAAVERLALELEEAGTECRAAAAELERLTGRPVAVPSLVASAAGTPRQAEEPPAAPEPTPPPARKPRKKKDAPEPPEATVTVPAPSGRPGVMLTKTAPRHSCNICGCHPSAGDTPENPPGYSPGPCVDCLSAKCEGLIQWSRGADTFRGMLYLLTSRAYLISCVGDLGNHFLPGEAAAIDRPTPEDIALACSNAIKRPLATTDIYQAADGLIRVRMDRPDARPPVPRGELFPVEPLDRSADASKM